MLVKKRGIEDFIFCLKNLFCLNTLINIKFIFREKILKMKIYIKCPNNSLQQNKKNNKKKI